MRDLINRPDAKVLLAAALALALGTQAGFAASGQRQSCSGILEHADDGDGYRLNPDPGTKSPWCPAHIGDGEHSPLAQRVLKTCPVGSHCHIEGLFVGHGDFYWTQISSVSLLKP
jgi:hypothetical protein